MTTPTFHRAFRSSLRSWLPYNSTFHPAYSSWLSFLSRLVGKRRTGDKENQTKCPDHLATAFEKEGERAIVGTTELTGDGIVFVMSVDKVLGAGFDLDGV